LLVNITCKGQCPRAKGYYIGLKRLLDTNNKWIWSNNVTWTQNETDVSKNMSKADSPILFFPSVMIILIHHMLMQVFYVILDLMGKRKSQYGINMNQIIIALVVIIQVNNVLKLLQIQI